MLLEIQRKTIRLCFLAKDIMQFVPFLDVLLGKGKGNGSPIVVTERWARS